MRYIAIILLLCLSGIAGAQYGPQYKLNNDYTPAVGTGDLIPKVAPTFDATNKAEGTHSVLFNAANERLITPDKWDLTQPWTIIFRIRFVGITTTSIIFGSRPTLTAKGITCQITTERQLQIYGGDGSNNGTAYGNYNQIQNSTWYTVAIRKNNASDQYFGIFVDGVRSTSADSIAVVNTGINDTISFGAGRAGSYSSSCNIDDISFYSRALTNAEILAIHGTPGMYIEPEPEPPPPARNYLNKVIAINNYHTDKITPTYEESPPADTISNDFSGKVLWVCEVDGNNNNTGLDSLHPIKMTGITAVVDTSFDYVVFSDTVHYGSFSLTNLDRLYGDRMVFRAWNKYGHGNAKLKALANVTGFTQSGNFWTKIVSGYPAVRNDILNTATEDLDVYVKNLLNVIYINGTPYRISQYPDTKTYLSIESIGATWGTDNQGIPTAGYWNGATMMTQIYAWVNSQLTVASYLANGTYNFSNIYGGVVPVANMKYKLKNHHNATNLNGEFNINNSTGSLEVYWDGNLNSQTVYVPNADSVIGVTGCSYLEFKYLEFYGGNKEQLKIKNSLGILVDSCWFHEPPVAAIVAYGNDTLELSRNFVYNSQDNGFLLGYNNYSTVSHNYMRNIGIYGDGGDRDVYHLSGIVSFADRGDVYIDHNVIDSVGYNGITVLHANRHNINVDVYKNWVNNYCMILTDGGAYYMTDIQAPVQKFVRGNLASNGYANKAYNTTGADITMTLYTDSAFPIDGSVTNRGWVWDSNTVYNCAQNSFNNINTAKIQWRNNLFVKMTSYQNGNDWGLYYKNVTNLTTIPDSCRYVRNRYLMGPDGSGFFGYIPAWNSFNAMTNYVDSNSYYNPFSSSSYVWRCFNNAYGSPAWGETDYTLAGFRAVTTWEDNSTLDSPSWSFSDVTGITDDQFIWFFANWSETVHSFNLGSTVFYTLGGVEVSGSLSLVPYQTAVLLYKSGGVPTFSTFNVYR